MPTLTGLVLYPIKSCAGITLHEATLSAAGLTNGRIHDREWMVVDADGVFMSQRTCPRMASITPRFDADTLEVRAPGMSSLKIPHDFPHVADARTIRVRVWDDAVDAYDCGEMAANWFSAALHM